MNRQPLLISQLVRRQYDQVMIGDDVYQIANGQHSGHYVGTVTAVDSRRITLDTGHTAWMTRRAIAQRTGKSANRVWVAR